MDKMLVMQRELGEENKTRSLIPPAPLSVSVSHTTRRGSRIQKGGGGFVHEFRLENRSYPDVHDFSLRMQVIIAND